MSDQVVIFAKMILSSGESFWLKDSLITHKIFELCLFRYLAQSTYFRDTLYVDQISPICFFIKFNSSKSSVFSEFNTFENFGIQNLVDGLFMLRMLTSQSELKNLAFIYEPNFFKCSLGRL